MLTFFPKFISHKAIAGYFVTLAIVSVLFMDRILPFIWMLFGIVEVCSFFYFSNLLTKRWSYLKPTVFVKKLFWAALIIRLIYMVFSYVFYDIMTGQPFMFYSADEQFYYEVSIMWREQGFDIFRNELQWIKFDDTGEVVWNGILCLLIGPFILTARIGHCFASALTCVLIYRIAQRHFEESTARMSALFCVLMPNLIYYCGLHLKEANMVFLTVLMVDSVDALLCGKKANWKHLVMAIFSAFALFAFRTPLGIVGLLSVMLALILNKGKLTSKWKRVGLAVLVTVILSVTTVGNRVMNQVNDLWGDSRTNQSIGMEYRSQRVGGNNFAKYASGVVFAPVIFTLPFASMVYTEGQENQQMLHGGNFAKNVMSGFVIVGLVMLLLSGDWRKHVLPLSLMIGYLVVIAFSNFAHSERFHQPVLPFELMFAAYCISRLQRKHVKWIDYWMVFVVVANVGWAWFKLAGRDML